MKKIALFVFNGDPMCFIHVLLNALDMKKKGHDVHTVIEGSAVKLIPELIKEGNPLKKLWEKAKTENLIAGVCKACSAKLGTLEAAEAQKLPLLDDMSGHPSMTGFMESGCDIMTF